MLFLKIPGNPVTKKNSQRIIHAGGRPVLLPSKAYETYEEMANYYIKGSEDPINFPVSVKCLYYMKTKRRVDLTNLLEATDDILVKCKILEDDNNRIIASHDGSRVLYDKEDPRVEIYIEKFTE